MNVTVSPDAMSARLTSVTFGSLRISTRCTDVSGPVRSAMTAPSSTRVAPPLPRSTWMTRTEPLTRRIRPQLFTATISAGRLTGVSVGVGPEDDGSHATTRPVNRRVRTRHRTSPLQPRARSGSLTAGDHVDRARERDAEQGGREAPRAAARPGGEGARGGRPTPDRAAGAGGGRALVGGGGGHEDRRVERPGEVREKAANEGQWANRKGARLNSGPSP